MFLQIKIFTYRIPETFWYILTRYISSLHFRHVGETISTGCPVTTLEVEQSNYFFVDSFMGRRIMTWQTKEKKNPCKYNRAFTLCGAQALKIT